MSTPSAAARAPQQIHGFLLRADEPVVHTFSRTPSFAWSPVRGAGSYEVELATSQSFSDNSIVWSATNLRMPTVAVPISLPWITGNPYSLYAHVRAVTNRGPERAEMHLLPTVWFRNTWSWGNENESHPALREVNGALLKLKRAKKNKNTGHYAAADADEIFDMVNEQGAE